MKWSLGISTIPISLGGPGIILNIFILTIYLRDWYKGKRPTACDLILSTMTFTNMFSQCILIAYGLIGYLQSNTIIPHGVYLFQIVIVFFIADTSFWQTALLSMYYFVKLFSFSHSLLQWVKKIISTSMNLLLLVSAGFCFLISLPIIWMLDFDSPVNVTEHLGFNDNNIDSFNLFSFFNTVLGYCFPFTLTFTCIALCVGSILKHAWSIRRNILQLSSPPQIGGLVRAAGTMVAYTLLDLACFMVAVGQDLTKYNAGEVVNTIYWVIFTLYPTARSIVLIIGNPQLKKQLVKMCASS